jgi:hypothetical protein
MIFLSAIILAASLQGGFTWTLYEGKGPLVLAHEIPDTPELRAVLECEPGSGVARLDLYGAGGAGGIATLSSGPAAATGESEAGGDHQSVALRVDHPVFGQFVATGRLDVAVAGRHRDVAVGPTHLAKLRRFAELCGG